MNAQQQGSSVRNRTPNELKLQDKASDRKLITAAFQLIDIFNNTAKRTNATIASRLQQQNQIQNAKLPARRVADLTVRAPVAKFIVTKVTETIRDSSQANRLNALDNTVERIQSTFNLKEVTKVKGNEKVQETVHVPRPKSQPILNKSCANSTPKNSNDNLLKDKNVIKSFDRPSQPKNSEVAQNLNQTSKYASKELIQLPRIEKNSKNLTRSTPFFSITKISVHSPKQQLSIHSQLIKSPNKVNVANFRNTKPEIVRLNANYNNVCMVKNLAVLQRLPDINNLDWHKRRFSVCSKDDHGKKLTRRHSCFAGTKAPVKLFAAIKGYDEFVAMHPFQGVNIQEKALNKKRGRPKKRISPNFTKNLLNSKDFSLANDLTYLKQPFRNVEQIAKIHTTITPAEANLRRSKRVHISPSKYGSHRKETERRTPFPDQQPVVQCLGEQFQRHVLTTNISTNEVNVIQSNESALSKIQPFLIPTSSIILEPVNIGSNETVNTFDATESLDNAYYGEIEYLEDDDDLVSPPYEPIIKPTPNKLGSMDKVRVIVNKLQEQQIEQRQIRIRSKQNQLLNLADNVSKTIENSVKPSGVLISLQLQKVMNMLPLKRNFRKRKYQSEPEVNAKKQVSIGNVHCTKIGTF